MTLDEKIKEITLGIFRELQRKGRNIDNSINAINPKDVKAITDIAIKDYIAVTNQDDSNKAEDL